MNNPVSKGYYSLIQYCPDLGRLEAANVGVILFSPDRFFLKARTVRGNARIIKFFGSQGHDWGRINAFKKGIEDRLGHEYEGGTIKTLADLQKFIDQRANLLQITSPRPMKVADPEKELDELFKEFTGETSRRTSSKSLRRLVAEKLSSAGLEKKLRRDITVSVPVLGKDVEIPFGFQNGRFNLINPVRFEAANPEQSVITACKYAVEGRSIADCPHPKFGDMRLVVVGKFRSKDEESPERVKRVFTDYGVKLYKTSDLTALIEEIRRTGKDIDSGSLSAT